MTSLVTLQRELKNHILDGDVLDRDNSLAAAIDATDAIPAATRLRIYSEAYRLRLIEALETNYPVLAQLIGADEFGRLTQLYLSAHPSRQFSIRWFGHELAPFLREVEDYRVRPWLAELADWEWKIAAAFDARDTELLTMSDLANVPPDQWPSLQLELHPSVQRLSLSTNVAAIVKAAGNGEALPQPAPIDERTEWLIWRRDLIVHYRSIDAVEATAIDALRDTAQFGALCENIAAHVDASEVPLRAVNFLRQWIADQAIVRIETDNPA